MADAPIASDTRMVPDTPAPVDAGLPVDDASLIDIDPAKVDADTAALDASVVLPNPLDSGGDR
jgi:hypothetical protein